MKEKHIEVSELVDILNIGWLKNKIEKIQRKAKKLGLEPIQMIVDPEEKVITSKCGGWVDVYKKVTLSGPIPKINGWSLVSVFTSFINEGTDFVFTRTLPGETLPYEPLEIKCDHCGQKRIRTKSFLLKDSSGQYKEVGSTCLKAFTGIDPTKFLFLASLDLEAILEEIDPDKNFGGGRRLIRLTPLLEITSACIKKWGWTSKTKASEGFETVITTEYDALRVLFSPSGKKEVEPNEENVREAKDAIEYFKSIDTSDAGEYIRNCHKMALVDYVPNGFTGIAVSMVRSYQMAMEKKLQSGKEENSSYIGDVKDKLDLVVKIVAVFPPSEFQRYPSWTYKMYDKGGNVLVWRASRKQDLEIGTESKIRGTVKHHSEYKGVKTTYITRCVVPVSQTA